jgi:hypothetical protein
MGIYTAGPLFLNDGATGTLIDQVQNLGFSPNLRRVLAGGDGLPDHSFLASARQEPDISFATTDLAAILGLASGAFLTAGQAISSALKAEFYFRQMANTSDRTTGATHLQLLVNKGLLIPTGLSADDGGVASCACQLAAVWDATNDPVTKTLTGTIPGTPTVTVLYTVGKVVVNAITLDDEVQGIAVDPGIRLIRVGGGGKIWPKFVAIQERQPTIRVRLSDAAALNSFGIKGVALTSGAIYFRKFSEGSEVYADGELQHVKVALYEGWAGLTGLSASGNELAGPELLIELTKPTANASMVATT